MQMAAMMGMMTYKNFVTEEWSHVLTWDLLVGRLIWLDGLKRNVFTPHSVQPSLPGAEYCPAVHEKQADISCTSL